MSENTTPAITPDAREIRVIVESYESALTNATAHWPANSRTVPIVREMKSRLSLWLDELHRIEPPREAAPSVVMPGSGVGGLILPR